jgi:GH35 family endo-1,4-beta-xylanase
MRNIYSVSSFILLASLAFLTGLSSAKAAETIYAGSMAFQSTGSSHDGNGWLLSENGYVGTFINVSSAGTVTITIKADGSIAAGTLPIMHLHIGDNNDMWSVTDHGGSHTTYSDYVAQFDLSAGMHAVRVEFVNDYTTSGDRNLYLKSVTFDDASLQNSATSTNALAAADNYIDNYRKSTATVNIPDGNVSEGTSVQVSLYNHAFNFGAAVYGHGTAPWTVSNPTPGSDYYNYQQFLNSHFNMIVPENAGKWGNNENNRDVVTMDAVDDMLDYAEDHNLRARMHCALWDYDDQEPDWLDTLEIDALTDPCAAAELWDEIMERIDYYIGDRAHRLTSIDGINEDYHRDLHTEVFGIDGVVDIYNEMAIAAAGHAKIAVNEYAVLDGGTYYRNWYREHIESIMNAGGTVELIGVQDHTSSYQYDAVNVFQNLQLLAGFELPIIITEFSIDEEEPGYTYLLTESMRLAFGNDMTDGFVMWGFWNYEDWIWRSGSALVSENWNLTAMGTAYEQLMDQWDTKETVYVDSNSQIQFEGFYGDYILTIGNQNYSFTFDKNTGATEPVIINSLYVDDNAPNDPGPGNPDVSDPNEDGTIEHPFDAIQEAIEAAYHDTVVIRDGTYTGNGNRDIYFRGRKIIVRSENGPNACVIDCQSTAYDRHRAFYFDEKEDDDSVLEGLTITNGWPFDEYIGTICCLENSSPIINNCVLIGNGDSAAGLGGAIGCSPGSEPTITNCTIIGNSSPFGGGIYCEESSPVIRNCILADNSSGTWGGGIYSYFSDLTVQNCTFSNNNGGYYGGGLYVEGGTVDITNCILWADTASITGPELEVIASGIVTVSYSDVEGGESAVEVEGGSTLIWDANNIELDPNFVNAGQNNYHLLPESPCIDAGDQTGSYTNQTDIDGNPRVLAEHVEIGVDEFTCVGDLNYNGFVNLVDFAPLGAYWQETGCNVGVECVRADLNRDTEVNWQDLYLFVQNWLTTVTE